MKIKAPFAEIQICIRRGGGDFASGNPIFLKEIFPNNQDDCHPEFISGSQGIGIWAKSRDFPRTTMIDNHLMFNLFPSRFLTLGPLKPVKKLRRCLLNSWGCSRLDT